MFVKMNTTLWLLLLSGVTIVPTSPTSICDGKAADVVFIIDTSGSIWLHDFTRHMLPFVRDVVNLLDVGPSINQTRVGMVSFSDSVHHQFHLNDLNSKEDIASAIFNIPNTRGVGFPHKALNYVTKEMFTEENGARDGIVHVAVILLDEVEDRSKMDQAAAHAIEEGILIFAVGIGSRINESELEAMVSDPKDEFVFHVRGFGTLDSIKENLASGICKVGLPER